MEGVQNTFEPNRVLKTYHEHKDKEAETLQVIHGINTGLTLQACEPSLPSTRAEHVAALLWFGRTRDIYFCEKAHRESTVTDREKAQQI